MGFKYKYQKAQAMCMILVSQLLFGIFKGRHAQFSRT